MQWETAIAVSTFCRKCGQHIEIAKGKTDPEGARSGSRPYLRFASEELWNGGVALAPEELRNGNTNGESNGSAGSRFSFLRKACKNGSRGSKAQLRSVACFECGQEQQISASAASTICSACNGYISLRDVHVRNDSRQKIKTRGDVTIHKKASLHGSSLACHDLEVLGTLSGGVQCTGQASFSSDCRILGVFSCASLIVNKRSKIHFLQPVYAHEIVVSGEATGDFYCSGNVTVKKNGFLRGELIARSVSVEPGGRLDASFRVSSQEAVPQSEPAHPLNGNDSRDHRRESEDLAPWIVEGAASPA